MKNVGLKWIFGQLLPLCFSPFRFIACHPRPEAAFFFVRPPLVLFRRSTRSTPRRPRPATFHHGFRASGRSGVERKALGPPPFGKEEQIIQTNGRGCWGERTARVEFGIFAGQPEIESKAKQKHKTKISSIPDFISGSGVDDGCRAVGEEGLGSSPFSHPLFFLSAGK